MVYVSWDECKEYFYPLPLLSDFQVPTILLFSSSFSSLFISRPLTSHAPTSLKVNFNIPKGGGGCELQKIGKFGPMELQNSAPKAPNFLKKQCFLTKKWAFLVKKHQIWPKLELHHRFRAFLRQKEWIFSTFKKTSTFLENFKNRKFQKRFFGKRMA